MDPDDARSEYQGWWIYIDPDEHLVELVDLDLDLELRGLGSKIPKYGHDKPCRIHQSMPQTGPYVVGHDPKLFWGG